jgi:hypothetical protein
MLLEFAEKMFIKLIENVDLYIEASPVRHSHEDFAATSAPGKPEQGIEHRHEDLGPLDREAFLSHVAGVEQALEKISLAKFVEDLKPFVPAELRSVARRFHALLQPCPFVRVLEVHILHADRPAVSLAKRRYDMPERRFSREKSGGGIEESIQVLLGQTETGKVQQCMCIQTP